MRKLILSLGLIGTLALVGACSDDSDNGGKNDTSEPSQNDGGLKFDTGNGQDDTGNGQEDTGTPQQDTGTEALDCLGIVNCAGQCTEQSCLAQCLGQGSQEAQDLFTAYNGCLNNAAGGSCASDCTNPQNPSQECLQCVSAACSDEEIACMGGGGEPITGFGDPCTQADPTCEAGLECIGLQGYEDGFCTASCNNEGGVCPGAPEGTMAACIMKSSPTTPAEACAFVCKISGQTYDCPGTMVCDPNEVQAGSGQHNCIPAQ